LRLKKRLGPRQKVRVLNKHDLMESAGEGGLETVMKIIGPAWRRPQGG